MESRENCIAALKACTTALKLVTCGSNMTDYINCTFGVKEGVLRHVLSLRQVLSPRNLMHSLHVWSLRHVLSLRGDKTYRQVHSLHVLSLLRQQHYNLSFPFLERALTCVCVVCVSVCVYVLMFICPWQRARPRVCCCVLCCVYYPRLSQP